MANGSRGDAADTGRRCAFCNKLLAPGRDASTVILGGEPRLTFCSRNCLESHLEIVGTKRVSARA